jgi:hypothetical protein
MAWARVGHRPNSMRPATFVMALNAMLLGILEVIETA